MEKKFIKKKYVKKPLNYKNYNSNFGNNEKYHYIALTKPKALFSKF